MFSFLDHSVILALCSILKLCVAILVICGLVHDHLGRRAVMKERERQRRLEELGIEEVDEYE